MSQDNVGASDTVAVTATPASGSTPTGYVECRVLSENGLFKNGVQYEQGDTVLLEAKTAANFAAAGDVEVLDA